MWRCVFRGTVLAAWLCLPALVAVEPALAGAWTRAEGEGLVAMTSGRQVGPIGAFATGAATHDKSFLSIHAEYGLVEALTVGLTVYADFSAVDLSDGTLAFGGLVRHRLWQDAAGQVVSVQLSGSLPAEKHVSKAMAASNPDSTPELQLSALYGKSWWGDWGSAFFSAGTGFAWRSEGTADEIRAELTAGVRHWTCCLAMMSVFATEAFGDPDARGLRLSPSVAITRLPEIARNGKKPPEPVNATTVQIGLSYDLVNPEDGLGFQIGYWLPF